MEEIWKPISGFEGWYEVSNLGRVRSLDRELSPMATRWGTPTTRTLCGRILSPIPNRDGRKNVGLAMNGVIKKRRIAPLVCAAFHGPRPDGYECCHNDGNPSNDIATNLRWDTVSANQMDRVAHGNSNRGERHGIASLSNFGARVIRRLGGCMSQRLIGEVFGVSQQTVSEVLTGKTYKVQ